MLSAVVTLSNGWHGVVFRLLQGFLAGASAEIFGAGPLLGQLSASPQPVLVVLALITAGEGDAKNEAAGSRMRQPDQAGMLGLC